jgi:hypothetical protein
MLVFKVGRNVVVDARAWKKDRTWGVFAALPHTYWLGVIEAIDGDKVTVTCVGCEGTFDLPRTALEVWWNACDEVSPAPALSRAPRTPARHTPSRHRRATTRACSPSRTRPR